MRLKIKTWAAWHGRVPTPVPLERAAGLWSTEDRLQRATCTRGPSGWERQPFSGDPRSSWFVREHSSWWLFPNGMLTHSHVFSLTPILYFLGLKLRVDVTCLLLLQYRANKNPRRRRWMSLWPRQSCSTGHGTMKHHLMQWNSLPTELGLQQNTLNNHKGSEKEVFQQSRNSVLTFN